MITGAMIVYLAAIGLALFGAGVFVGVAIAKTWRD